jgi:hypothetical protein
MRDNPELAEPWRETMDWTVRNAWGHWAASESMDALKAWRCKAQGEIDSLRERLDGVNEA